MVETRGFEPPTSRVRFYDTRNRSALQKRISPSELRRYRENSPCSPFRICRISGTETTTKTATRPLLEAPSFHISKHGLAGWRPQSRSFSANQQMPRSGPPGQMYGTKGPGSCQRPTWHDARTGSFVSLLTCVVMLDLRFDPLQKRLPDRCGPLNRCLPVLRVISSLLSSHLPSLP